VRKAAESLCRHATLIAGHSAHVIHGVGGNVLYDLGDFLEAYPGERAAGSFVQRALRRGFQELRRVGTDLVTGSGRGTSLPVQGAPQGRLRRLLREARAYRLRGDTSLLFLVTLNRTGPLRLQALPLKLTHSHTRLAHGAEGAAVRRRFRRACRALGTPVVEEGGRLVVTW
jgi:poly-gamma-glutamate synthesis protein (capsule biosynthesis protein)